MSRIRVLRALSLLIAINGAMWFTVADRIPSALAVSLPGEDSPEWDRDDQEDNSIEMRRIGERREEWRHPDLSSLDQNALVGVQILGINDFHGQISKGRLSVSSTCSRTAIALTMRVWGACFCGGTRTRWMLVWIVDCIRNATWSAHWEIMNSTRARTKCCVS